MWNSRITKRRHLIELGCIVTIIGIFAAVMLPSLARGRESARRASCQNNLKQLGLICKMYANESKGELYPPLSPTIDNWMFDMRSIYPEYLTDLNVLICPSSPFNRPNVFNAAPENTPDTRCVTSLYYIYTGYTIFSDEQGEALFDAYMMDPEKVIRSQQLDLPMPLTPDSTRIFTGAAQNAIPLVWDRVPESPEDSAHVPGGINVLHMDGHVEFVRYSFYNSSNFFPATRVGTETFGSVLPTLPRFCYSQ